jgi:hypothetical protein
MKPRNHVVVALLRRGGATRRHKQIDTRQSQKRLVRDEVRNLKT